MAKKIIDVSRGLDEKTAVWPGDTTFSRRAVMSIAEGCSCNVSTITMSLHTGTHADAPSHYLPDAPAAHQVNLAN